jgi:DNA-binding Xre family transcriptional regulator
MTSSELIGKVLGDKIVETGANYSQFAKKVGLSQSYMSKIINGESTDIKLKTLEKIVQALQMTVSDFMQEVEKKKPLLA